MKEKRRDEDQETGKSQLDFAGIYASYWPKIYRYMSRLVGSREAEDLTQEILIKVGNAVHTFRNESQLSTWIYRIATYAAIDRMRKPDFRQETSKTKLLNDVVKDTGTIAMKVGCGKKTSLVEGQAIRQESNSCIRRIVEELPEKYRTVIILSEMEGLKNKEIAEILEISQDTVKVRLHRARVQLKNDFLKRCDFYWDERNEMACDPKNSTEM